MTTSAPALPETDNLEPDIVFSSRDGFVWVSWPDTSVVVRLGRDAMVAAMMQNYLAQDALGRQLCG